MENLDLAVLFIGPSIVWRLASLFHTPSTMAAFESSVETSVPSMSNSSSKFSVPELVAATSFAKSATMAAWSRNTRRTSGWAGGNAGDKEVLSSSATLLTMSFASESQRF
jgi:hypothetical protein